MIEFERYRIEGVHLGRSTPATDARGSAAQVFDAAALRAAGGPALSWVDLLQSRSLRATIRGLHVRRDLRQWKQIRVVQGVIFDVVIDLRPESDTFRRAVTVELGETGHQQVIIPPGCAHGFQVLSEHADVSFASSVATDVSLDAGFRFDSAPSLDFSWPLPIPIIGERDAALPPLAAVSPVLEQAFRAPVFA